MFNKDQYNENSIKRESKLTFKRLAEEDEIVVGRKRYINKKTQNLDFEIQKKLLID